MNAVFDDCLCAFFRALTTQVGNALFSNDDVYVMFCMVVVRYHRNNGADLTFLGDGRTSKDGNISVACEVTASANTVHHFRAADMCRVNVSVEVSFDSRVDGDNSQTAYNFRTIGDFRRAEHQFITEEVHIIINTLQTVVCYSE